MRTLIHWKNKSFKFPSGFVYFIQCSFLGWLHNSHFPLCVCVWADEFMRSVTPLHMTAQSIAVLMHLGWSCLISYERDTSKTNTRGCALPDRCVVWWFEAWSAIAQHIGVMKNKHRRRVMLTNPYQFDSFWHSVIFLRLTVWLVLLCLLTWSPEQKGDPAGNPSPMLIDRSFKQYVC